MACASSGPRFPKKDRGCDASTRLLGLSRRTITSDTTHLLVLLSANPDPSTEEVDLAIVPSTFDFPALAYTWRVRHALGRHLLRTITAVRANSSRNSGLERSIEPYFIGSSLCTRAICYQVHDTANRAVVQKQQALLLVSPHQLPPLSSLKLTTQKAVFR